MTHDEKTIHGCLITMSYTERGAGKHWAIHFKLYVDGELKDQTSGHLSIQKDWTPYVRSGFVGDDGKKHIVELQAKVVQKLFSTTLHWRFSCDGVIVD